MYSMRAQPTIFIVVSMGLLMRNVLRTGVCRMLHGAGYRIIVLLSVKSVPAYLEKEFPYVEFIPHKKKNTGKIHRQFIKLTHYFIWNSTMRRYFKYSRQYIDRSILEAYFHIFLLRAVSAAVLFFPLLKRLTRRIEKRFFPEEDEALKRIFDRCRPDVVLATSITSTIDVSVLKEAERRGISTVGMTRSWDNVTKMYLRFIPDYLLVQNDVLKERLTALQDVPRGRIYVTGFTNFDWYARKEVVRPREDYLRSLGLDPDKPVLFFGAQGPWFDKDYTIAEQVYEWVRDGKLAKPCQMIVRPYFKELEETPLLKLKGKENVYYDDKQHIVPEFSDSWDPTEEETAAFVNTIVHSDILILVLSTLALDGACTDTPVINAIYASRFRKGRDVTPLMRLTEHYEWVFKTEGTAVARGPRELKEWINRYLKNPNIKSGERELLRNTLCYKIDGGACRRVVDAVRDITEHRGRKTEERRAQI